MVSKWTPRLAETKRVILLVEHHLGFGRALRSWLSAENFHVEAAADFPGALALLEICRPDLFCIDLMLPDDPGVSLCERIRSDPRFRFVPILAMSGRSSPEDLANLQKAGANAFLKKPFTRDKLLKYVRVLLDGPQPSPDGPEGAAAALRPISLRRVAG
jgi:DNA-binding response OmpR family regulator